MVQNILLAADNSRATLQRIKEFLDRPRILDGWFLLGTMPIVNSMAANIVDGDALQDDTTPPPPAPADLSRSPSRRSKRVHKLSGKAAKVATELFRNGHISNEAYFSAIVARTYSNGFWCEEFVVVANSRVSFYSVSVTLEGNAHALYDPVFALKISDILRFSLVPEGTSSLVGYFVMEIDTVERTHYLAFSSYEARNDMSHSLLIQMSPP
jgi:hypothetical protein